MPELKATLIDVGWGDSIFLEFLDDGAAPRYALIDSNDTTYNRSTAIFLKRYANKLKKQGIPFDTPAFEFVLLTHAHADHGQGLKGVMREYKTRQFLYPRSANWGPSAYLLDFQSSLRHHVDHHQAVDDAIEPFTLNGTRLEFLWPRPDGIDEDNENNNSVVTCLTLGDVSFVLTGDAEHEVWRQIAGRIPAGTRFFKVPHHGSWNGTFDRKGDGRVPSWIDHLPGDARLAISSDGCRYDHPFQPALDLFEDNNRTCYRTDHHYHLTFRTDGTDMDVKYSRY